MTLAMTLTGTKLGRVLALALAVMSLAAAYITLIAPLHDRFDQARESLRAQGELLARLKERTLPNKQMAEAAVPNLTGGLLYEGDNEPLLVASLQSTVRSIGEASGWRASSIRVLPVRQEGPLRHFGIEARITTSIEGLRRTLLALETARPVLAITVLHVSAIEVFAPNADDGDQDRLNVRFEVFGAAAAREERR